MTVARTTGHIPSVANGADAVSYEIVPSTLVVSLDKNDNWASGTTIYQSGNDKYAVVTFLAYKVTGGKREPFSDCYWLGGSSNPIGTSFYTRYMAKTDTSVDITLCKLTWTSNGTPTAGEVLARVTVAVNKAGKDGTSGKSVQCQYSADASSWHSSFVTGDAWMRTRIEGGSWGAAMRIVGERGTNGEYTKYSFGISSQESTSGVGVKPSDVSSWSDAPLVTTKDKPYLWMQVVKYDGSGKAGAASYVRINGKDGKDGASVAIKGSFSSTSQLPSNAAAGDGYIIDGNLWIYTGDTTSGNVNGFINAGSIKGDPGQSATQYYYHIAWCNDLGTYADFTVSNPSGAVYVYMGICYTDSIGDPTDKSLYKWSKIEGKPAVTYELALDTRSVTADGKTGAFLTTDLGKYRFIRHTGGESEQLSWVYDSYYYLVLFVGYDGKVTDYSTNEGTDEIYNALTANVDVNSVAMMKFFWYDKEILSDGYDYISALVKSGGLPTSEMGINILASNTFTVVKQGVDGNRGSSGAIWRQHRGFVESAYSYMAGGNDERFLDVVYLNKHWYRCIKSYTSEGVNDERNLSGSGSFLKYWTTADMSGFTFIATDFLLAENAQINLFGSQEINLLKDTETGEIFGSYRVPNGNGDDGKYALWLGGKTGSEAPFSVTKDGVLTANSGSIGGLDIYNYSDDAKGLHYERGESVYYPPSVMYLTRDKLLIGASGGNGTYGANVEICPWSGGTVGINGVRAWNFTGSALAVEKNIANAPVGWDIETFSVASTGYTGYVNIAENISAENGGTNIGVNVSASGGQKNYAFNAACGDIRMQLGKILGFRINTRVVATSQTLTDDDCVLICKNGGGDITLTLPSDPVAGQVYMIYNVYGTTVSVATTSSHPVVSRGHDYPNGTTNYAKANVRNQLTVLVYSGDGYWYSAWMNG